VSVSPTSWKIWAGIALIAGIAAAAAASQSGPGRPEPMSGGHWN
jgi:hypothetical protein